MTSNYLDYIFGLSGKTALVIGAGGHICSQIARGFSNAGARVFVADIRISKAELVANEINSLQNNLAIPVELDASRKESFFEFLKQFENESIDILVNGAGINSAKPILEIEISEWNEVFNSQLTATLFGCQVIGEHMIRNGSGSIINISSASAEPALSKAFPYSAAKAGIRNLTQNLGREWATRNVRVNALRPGFFPTDWNRKNFITPEREKAILDHTPMKRFGIPEELAPAAIFLASKASSFITGSELIVDGGFSAMTI